jgi:hypothetical protein
MPRFKAGDRVVHRDRRDEPGTVVEVIEEGNPPPFYLCVVRWDGGTRGRIMEDALEPLPR